MLSRTFTTLTLTVARINLVKNKRDVQMKHMRRELAQLLESGEEQTARIRVEHVIREEKTISAYDLIERYCVLIRSRLPIIESQMTCPIDLKEAIASVIFASPRCADIPELMDIRKHFTAKYGKEFVNSALEVQPNCGVSHLLLEKLSARTPDAETKIKILTSIAEEHNVKWVSEAFEEERQKQLLEKLSARTPDVETKIKILTSIAEEHNVKWVSKAFEEEHQKPEYKLEKVGEKLSVRASDDETKVKTLTSISRGHDVNLDLNAFEELLRNKRHKLKKVGEKLSTRAPDVETKIKISTSVGQEHDVAWDSRAFEEHLQKPSDDLLNVRKGSSQNDTASSKLAVSYTNNESSSTEVPFCSQPKTKASENIYGNIERGYYGEGNASWNYWT